MPGESMGLGGGGHGVLETGLSRGCGEGRYGRGSSARHPERYAEPNLLAGAAPPRARGPQREQEPRQPGGGADALVYAGHADGRGGVQGTSHDAVIALLAAIGANVAHLDLSGHSALTDDVLAHGITTHMHALASLALTHLPELRTPASPRSSVPSDDVLAHGVNTHMHALASLALTHLPELTDADLAASFGTFRRRPRARHQHPQAHPRLARPNAPPQAHGRRPRRVLRHLRGPRPPPSRPLAQPRAPHGRTHSRRSSRTRAWRCRS
ncbi:hypothetical protein B0H14DRAFT_1415978 [Mycena olivaceomarginata]|nr:hypothetical protein B0H14DRAFT_1415978 [Mycena olivaceomarginata]